MSESLLENGRSVPRFKLSFPLIVFLSLLLLPAEAWLEWSGRLQRIRDVEANAANLARSLVQEADGTFGKADMALIAIVDRLETDGTNADSLAQTMRLMKRQLENQPELRNLSIYGSDGRLLITTLASAERTASVADRDYFQHHRARSPDTVQISPAVRSRLDDEWIVTTSRRFSDAHGSFGGVVVASIAHDTLTRSFTGFDIGSLGSIALIRSDGRLMARRPVDPSVLGTPVLDGTPMRSSVAAQGAGVFRYVSPIDGVDRVGAYQSSARYPVTLLVGRSLHQALANWSKNAALRITAVISIAIMMIILGKLLTRQAARREAAEKTLAEMATTDGLTRLANRRLFDRALEVEWRRAARESTQLSVLLLDVDHFKAFNDEYGHLKGDDTLRNVAKAIDTAIRRPGDLAARYGGEEFAVILPNTGRLGAMEVAERVRRAILALNIPHASSMAGVVSASIGIATVAPSPLKPLDTISLLETADAGLYRAKAAGRNRVETTQPAEAA